jgi:hypothetical protein
VRAEAWTDDEMAMTVAFVRGLSVRELGDVLGFRWDTEREATWQEAWEDADETAGTASTVQVGEIDGWLAVAEPNGYAASWPEVVARLSRGGTAVSVFWNVNALMRFVLARDGAVVRSFDPLAFTVAPVGEPLAEEEGLPFGDPRRRPEIAALTLAERLTGIRLGRSWDLDTPRRTWTTRSSFPGDA